MALIDKLTAIANAIRTKTGKTEPLTLDQMATEIEAIETGGGGTDTLGALLGNTLTEYSNNELTQINGHAFYSNTSLVSVDFPLVTSIGTYAFNQCSSLQNLNFPSVTSTGTYAFFGCTALTEISFPLFTSVATSVFRGCSNLTSVDLPSVKTLGASTFQGCNKLTVIDLPLVESIGTNAFNACSGLNTVILRNTEKVCAIAAANVFSNTPFASSGKGGKVYVPEALIDSYKTASYWSTLYEGGKCEFVAIEGSEYE